MIYDVSIIIPFYKKYNDFVFALSRNYKQFEEVNEVIILFDEVIDINDYIFLKDYNINFKCIMNNETHDWRNPAVVINVGIKSAISDKCIVISPESILLDNTIKELVENTDNSNFCVGYVVFIKENDFEQISDYDDLFMVGEKLRTNYKIGPTFYGSICCKKSNFKKVNYYTEIFSTQGWGGEDDNVRVKLMKNGINMIKNPKARVIHLENEESFTKRLNKEFNRKNNPELYKNFNFINIFKNLSFNLDTMVKANYLENNQNIKEIVINNSLKYYYPVILLCQCYNENKNIKEFLENMENFVDGIIVLDDDSTDNSWDLLESPKILMKIKKERITFNDIQNRNILLNAAEEILIKNKIKIDWFLWLDFDERIYLDKNMENVKKYLLSFDNEFNILKIPMLHMWNDTKYNADYPYSENGIQFHKRLFRNKISEMPYQIKTDKTLHFSLIPYEGKIGIIPILIKHLGRNSEEIRKLKYENYTRKYDPDLKNQSSYEHFLKNDVKLISYEKMVKKIFDLIYVKIKFGEGCELFKDFKFNNTKLIEKKEDSLGKKIVNHLFEK